MICVCPTAALSFFCLFVFCLFVCFCVCLCVCVIKKTEAPWPAFSMPA